MSQELTIRIQASRQAIGALDTAQILYLLIEARAPQEDQIERLPLNLCLVVDRSTSMRGDRLERVKAAANLVVEKLNQNDIISVVAFSDHAEVVLPAGHLTNPAILAGRIRNVTPSGGTEIYQGLYTGLHELNKYNSSSYNNQLILLTDGHTYGDAESCIQLAEKAALKEIGISAFGIGSEWNDQFLDRLVTPSGGQSAYIETAGEIIDHLQKRIQGLGAIYAQNMRLLADLPVGVNLRYAFKVAPFAQPLTLGKELNLGAVENQTSLTALLELAIEPQLPDKVLNIPLHLVADIPSQHVRNKHFKHQFELPVMAEAPSSINPPAAIIRAVRALSFYRMNERVWEDVEDGDLTAATLRLKRLTTRLLESGYTRLAEQAYAETERLTTMGTLSLEGRKRLKYGTRSLITQTLSLDIS